MKNKVVALMMFATVGFSMPTFATEPSLHEVYQAANAGKLDDAQHMMKNVLQAHPNSGKAHYVEAELLVKQGNLKQAANELASAEKLAPGLPFANAQSVSSLREAISHHTPSLGTTTEVRHSPFAAPTAEVQSGLPWGMIFTGLGLVAFILWATRMMSRRNAVDSFGSTQRGPGGYQPAYPSGPTAGAAPGYGAPQGYGGPGMAPAGPGLGSQLMGGLATGAAVGAGVVAGEALMHHFMDGNKAAPTSDRAFSSFNNIPDLPSTPLSDMGGNDFGINDSSSWDDGGSSSDSDWN
jgi:uncharacterized protein